MMIKKEKSDSFFSIQDMFPESSEKKGYELFIQHRARLLLIEDMFDKPKQFYELDGITIVQNKVTKGSMCPERQPVTGRLYHWESSHRRELRNAIETEYIKGDWQIKDFHPLKGSLFDYVYDHMMRKPNSISERLDVLDACVILDLPLDIMLRLYESWERNNHRHE